MSLTVKMMRSLYKYKHTHTHTRPPTHTIARVKKNDKTLAGHCQQWVKRVANGNSLVASQLHTMPSKWQDMCDRI